MDEDDRVIAIIATDRAGPALTVVATLLGAGEVKHFAKAIEQPETIGDKVPENVELYPIPPEVAEKVPQVKSHMFFVKDDTIILVRRSGTYRIAARSAGRSNDMPG
jgi:hypothetical protein